MMNNQRLDHYEKKIGLQVRELVPSWHLVRNTDSK